MGKKWMILLMAVFLTVQAAGCGNKDIQESTETESAAEDAAADSDSQSDLPEESETGEVSDEDFGPAYISCELPKGFEEYSGDEGLYVTKNYPSDLSTISYDISDNFSISIENLTQDVYQNMLESDFLRNYGDDVTVNIKSYKTIVIDGRAGLRIQLGYAFKGTDYEQLVYIIYNSDEVHCLTFTQEKDAGWMDDFEECGETIHMISAE